MLGVDKEIIKKFGVYSCQTALEMAKVSIKKGPIKENLIGVGITGTLTGVDEKNADSFLRKVFYAIAYPDGNSTIKEITLENTISRHQMKEFIVQIVMQEILTYIN